MTTERTDQPTAAPTASVEAALPNGPLALIGMRGAGKTTVGKLLAERIGRPFLDLDQETLRRAREAGVEVASAGELLRANPARFRDFEAAALRRICEPSLRVVLACGGGVIEHSDSRAWLRRSARVVWLDVPLAKLRERVAKDGRDRRPSLTGADPVEELEAVLARRVSQYRALSDHVVAVGELDVGPAAAAVLVAVQRGG